MRETGDPTRETDTAAEVPRARATTVHIFWSREADAMGSTKNDQLFYIYSIYCVAVRRESCPLHSCGRKSFFFVCTLYFNHTMFFNHYSITNI